MAKRSKKTDKASFSIEGEMTIYRATELKASLAPVLAANKEVEIDLARVTEMDSAGLQLMISIKLESVLRGTSVCFVGHSEAVQQVLDSCDLGGFFGDPVVLH